MTPYETYTYQIDRSAVVSCDPCHDDDRHPNCRHAWNAAHPDDPVTADEQVKFSAGIPWRQT